MTVQTSRGLRGASPGDLPIELTTRMLLVANRACAKKLGIELPRDILLRADRVVE